MRPQTPFFLLLSVLLLLLHSATAACIRAPSQPKQCYAVGERCKGAEGHPPVAWLGANTAEANGGCCGSATCAGKASDGDWGTYCTHFFSEPNEPVTRCTAKGAVCERDAAGVVLVGCCDKGFVCGGEGKDVCQAA